MLPFSPFPTSWYVLNICWFILCFQWLCNWLLTLSAHCSHLPRPGLACLSSCFLRSHFLFCCHSSPGPPLLPFTPSLCRSCRLCSTPFSFSHKLGLLSPPLVSFTNMNLCSHSQSALPMCWAKLVLASLLGCTPSAGSADLPPRSSDTCSAFPSESSPFPSLRSRPVLTILFRIYVSVTSWW